MRKKGTLLFGLIVLALLWLLMLFFNWDRIEQEIKTDSSAVLDHAGYASLDVDTDHRGRTVHLSGVMRSRESIDQAVAMVKQVDGVHRVSTSDVELKPYLPAMMSLSSNGEAMTLLGSMSSGAAADQFRRQTGKTMGMPLDHGISIDPDVESPQWLTGLSTAMPAVTPVENLQLNVRNRALSIAGISRNEEEHRATLGAIQNLPGIDSVDSSGLIFKLREPSWFELSGGELSGTFGSNSEAVRLQQVLTGLTSPDGDMQLEVDAEYAVAGWMDDLERITANADGVESPVISFREGVMRVSGVVRTQEAFDALANQAPSLTHTRQLNLADLALRPFEAPWMQLQVSPDKILLQGMVRDAAVADRLLQQVVDATGAGFSGVVENQMQPGPDSSPATWAAEMGGLIAGMTATETGNLSLRDGVLTLSGIVRDEPVFSQLKSDSAASGVADTIDNSKLAFRPWKTPKFAVSAFGSRAVASGRLGDTQDASILAEAVGLVFGANESTRILVDPDVTDAAWLNDVMGLMPAMTGLENASLTATNGKIDIEGIARTQESYELVEKAVKDTTAKGLINNVSLRPWQQPSLEISVTDRSIQASGSMPDKEAVQKFNTQLTKLGNEKNIPLESAIAIGEDVQNTRWLGLVSQALPSLAALENPGLRVADGLMTLSGQTLDQSARDIAVSSMSDAADSLNVKNSIVYIPPLVVQTGAGSVGVVQEEIERCEDNLDAQMKERNIEFASSSALITPGSTPLLISLLQAMRDCPEVLIEVSGHTDITGNNDYNLELSEQRAQAVVEYLVRGGIPESTLEARGYGSERPIADNQTAEGRAANRRIEFNIKITR